MLKNICCVMPNYIFINVKKNLADDNALLKYKFVNSYFHLNHQITRQIKRALKTLYLSPEFIALWRRI